LHFPEAMVILFEKRDFLFILLVEMKSTGSALRIDLKILLLSEFNLKDIRLVPK